MTRPDNPAAFPVSDGTCTQQGMDLRDYFAAQAMIGIMSTAGAFQRADRREEMVARKAYEFADALLLARKEDGNG